MTVEEIKATYTMRDILAEYGIKPNRAGFIRCPFHSEKTASCKIYQRDFHCFACGANGDVLSFVQQMEECSFKDAFKKLGGTYEEQTEKERERARYERQKAAETRQRREARLKARKMEILSSMGANRFIKENTTPFSWLWCRAVDGFERDYLELGEIMEKLRGNQSDS